MSNAPVHRLVDVLGEFDEGDAIVQGGRTSRYLDLRRLVEECARQLVEHGVSPGGVVALEAEFSPRAVGILLALALRRCVVVPLTASVRTQMDEYLGVAEAEHHITVGSDESVDVRPTGRTAVHELYARLRASGDAGLVLFSSGSSGKSKAALHSLPALLEKFATRRAARRMVGFLLFDHIGGLNTLFYSLSTGGCLIVPADRSPDGVLAAIDTYRGEVLPTSPTFLNLMLISEAYRRHDLSSLRLITYGTEPMPESTLRRVHVLLPAVDLQQTYGLSELGILRAKSRAPDSLWVRIGGEGFETRVADGLLEIRARSAMLGYLNAASPFTDDGWFRTGDAVETDGEYFRILGRRSEMINVGGQKVFPQEVESVLMEFPDVAEATVSGVSNPITGQIVCARVRPRDTASRDDLVRRLRAHCAQRLERFKIPVKFELVDAPLHGERFKKRRA